MMLTQKIAKILLEKKAVQISLDPPFTWTSGIRSPIYCDNRILLSFVDAREMIVAGFCQLIEENKLEFDAIAGVATGAIGFGALVADRLGKPFCYVRPEPRAHGTGKQVEGAITAGSKVLVIEDLFSTAGSSVKTVLALRKEIAADVVGIIAISTYEFVRASTNLNDAKVPWWTLTNFSTLVSELDLPIDQKEAISKFATDPDGWWDTVRQ